MSDFQKSWYSGEVDSSTKILWCFPLISWNEYPIIQRKFSFAVCMIPFISNSTMPRDLPIAVI